MFIFPLHLVYFPFVLFMMYMISFDEWLAPRYVAAQLTIFRD